MFPSLLLAKKIFWTQINTDFQDLKTKYPFVFTGSIITIPIQL